VRLGAAEEKRLAYRSGDFLDDENCLTVACCSSERRASMILIPRQRGRHLRPFGTLREQELIETAGDEQGAKRLWRER
jgi:hypothetical protein